MAEDAEAIVACWSWYSLFHTGEPVDIMSDYNVCVRNSLSKDFDKYYTNEVVCDAVLKHIDTLAYDFVLEPSAGNGVFLDRIENTNKLGLDIHPEKDGIQRQDYFEYSVPEEYSNVLVIGNPPFGKSHSLSTAFIKHSLSFSNVSTIAFVLPNVYKKYTRQRILPQEWRIKHIIDIGENAFTFDGEVRHVPCSFFVFDKSKGRDLRAKTKAKETADFLIVTKDEYDLFVFGASPKKVIEKAKENNRGHFLKVKKNKDLVKRRIQSVDWVGNSCANGGVFWLTQVEFVEQYDNYLLTI